MGQFRANIFCYDFLALTSRPQWRNLKKERLFSLVWMNFNKVGHSVIVKLPPISLKQTTKQVLSHRH